MSVRNIDKLDSIIVPMLRAARIPGAALAIVAGDKTVFSKGYGYRDLEAQLPLTSDTIYPIASTTKAINATLLGMLVDERRIAWDAPVQEYLPRFRLQDPFISAAVTVRDLLVMRTGLPRHDFLWTDNPISRAHMVECLAHLPLSARFRERFQYNNLSAAAAGYIAEVVTGQSWNDLVRERILEPLCMNSTRFSLPPAGNTTLSYHESHDRRLVVTRRLETEPIGPAGGCIHSTVDDMTRWMAFNLSGGKVAGRQLIEPGTLQEIQSPCLVMGGDTASPSPKAAYGLGWFVDTYNGRSRVSHTGWLHDVNGCLTLFPDEGLGIVSFINFASSRIAQLINQCAFDLLMDLVPVQTLKDALAKYEKNVEDTRRRNKSVRRIENAAPSHPLTAYAGSYQHAGYGKVEIVLNGQVLGFVRNSLVLPMEHWHYDAWVIAENDLFEIHKQQPFERANRILFETSADGEIIAFSMQVEPTVAPMRFTKQ